MDHLSVTKVIFPGTFEQAINSPSIQAGDSLLLHAGTYKGAWVVKIGGSDGLPITIKPYGDGNVILDGSIVLTKPHMVISDLEITNSDTNRVCVGYEDVPPSITMDDIDQWLIGCEIHDLHNSGVNWMGSGMGGVVECVIYNNGIKFADGSSHGHGIYTHNHMGGARLIARNLFGNSWGEYTIHIYSASENYLRDYTVEDNVINGDPAICGGGLGLRNYLCQRNIQFGDYWYQGKYSLQPNDGGIIRDNLFINLANYAVQSTFKNLIEENNTVWNGEPANRAGYNVEPMPAKWSRFIPFTLSQRWAGIQVDFTDGVFSAAIVEL